MRARGVMSWLRIGLLSLQTACGGLLVVEGLDGRGVQGPPRFNTGFNLFSPEQDIELGRLSAEEVTRQLPLLRDERTARYVQRLGERLAAKAPGYPFTYRFFVVASPEINAFALPGGYVFVNAGAIEAARDEGELAGGLPPQNAHVALPHGADPAAKAYLAQKGLSGLPGLTGGRPRGGRAVAGNGA